MQADFTIEVYIHLLKSLREGGYNFNTLSQLTEGHDLHKKIVVLRHDIDNRPYKALEFARIEKELNIDSTFFFRKTRTPYDEDTIKKIADLGYEIGYHYRDLTEAKGNSQEATRLFKRNLNKLRKFYPIKTICMDGSAWSKWNNLELWKHASYRNYGIICEPYLDLDFNEILYLSDTGRKWNTTRYSLYDKVKTKYSYNDKSTFDIIHDLENGSLPDRIMITTHPQRWHSGIYAWTEELVSQWLKNRIKYVIIKWRRKKQV